MPATAIVIFAHGSSIESANESVRGVVEMVRRDGGFDLVEAAFLEQGTPDLARVAARFRAQHNMGEANSLQKSLAWVSMAR